MGKRGKGVKQKTIAVNPRMMQFQTGELSFDDLDDEEIRRGQFRSAAGTFQGRPVDMVPRKFYDELVRETVRRANNEFRMQLQPMIGVLTELATTRKVAADARHKSAVYLLERTLGKVPDKTIIEATVKPWEDNIEGLIVETPEVVKGEVVKEIGEASEAFLEGPGSPPGEHR